MTDFVIINYNTPVLTCKCIETIFLTYSPDADIVVVDNASSDNSAEYISGKYPNVKLIVNSQNSGYAKAVNTGVFNTKKDFVLVCNSDVEFHPGSLHLLEKMMFNDKSVGAAGFYQFYPDLTPQRSFGMLPGFKLGIMDMYFLTAIKERIQKILRKNKINKTDSFAVEYIDGAALMMRRKVFEELEGFDENFFFYTEEADFCKRVQNLGFKTVINPLATITHIRGASSDNKIFNEQSEKMLIKTKIQFILKHGNKFEAKFFIFTQWFHFLTISCIEKIISFLPKFKHFRDVSKKHYIIYQLWLRTKVE